MGNDQRVGATDSSDDPIKHVVLLLLENHSFDQMLGCFKKVYPDLEGIDPSKAADRTNHDESGNAFVPCETKELQVNFDPKHEHTNVMRQLENSNRGFVRDFATEYPESSQEDRQNIMGYYPLDFLPALHALARDFTICDHWFSSLPGPTWPNRFFALSGTSSGRVIMPDGPLHPALRNTFDAENQSTLFDRLNEASKSWKVYYYDFPSSLILTHQRKPENLSHYFQIETFFKDASLPDGDFPSFAFIEPKYFGLDQNDDHPPHNIMKAEKLIADVFNALRSNEDLWLSTLLVVLYDEHGGFYDHVPPPPTQPPDQHTEECTFTQLGVRVPALLVSPWVAKGVVQTVFDHTSLLKYLIEKWQLKPLGERTANAESIKSIIGTPGSARKDTLQFIRVPYSQLISPKPELESEQSAHHKALHAFADLLQEDMHKAMDKDMAKALMLVSEESRSIVKLKAKIGSGLIWLGKQLRDDLETHKKQRIDQTTAIVSRFINTAKQSTRTP